jgi:hypothetical protein
MHSTSFQARKIAGRQAILKAAPFTGVPRFSSCRFAASYSAPAVRQGLQTIVDSSDPLRTNRTVPAPPAAFERVADCRWTAVGEKSSRAHHLGHGRPNDCSASARCEDSRGDEAPPATRTSDPLGFQPAERPSPQTDRARGGCERNASASVPRAVLDQIGSTLLALGWMGR